jgi:L-asparaginase
MPLPSVTIFTLGGTIAMKARPGRGATPRLSAKALVGAVPELARVARVSTRELRRVPGAHVTLEDTVALARAIIANGRPAVVTQGTDTIEETAFALDILIGTKLPVVVTGAMRHPELAGADGPANLLAAVTVVSSPEARAAGALVVMNDRIHAAALVRKGHTSTPDAFVSPTTGPIGFVAEGKAHILARPLIRCRIPLSARPRDTRPVALLASHLDDDGMALRAVMREDIAGLVVAGMGGGHLPPIAADEAAMLARRIPVVMASRTGAGAVLSRTYGFAGSEMDLAARGLIRAGWLDTPKARVLLALACRAGFDKRRIRDTFAVYGGG